MRIDFTYEVDGRECWACFDDGGNLIQLASKSFDVRLMLRGPEWTVHGVGGYEWHHWPLEGELALYAYRVMMKELDQCK